jgi:uncharacterized membrane-anchored protein
MAEDDINEMNDGIPQMGKTEMAAAVISLFVCIALLIASVALLIATINISKDYFVPGVIVTVIGAALSGFWTFRLRKYSGSKQEVEVLGTSVDKL